MSKIKAVISTTYDDKYLFMMPICVWAWNKLGIDCICIMPYLNTSGSRFMLCSDFLLNKKMSGIIYNFDSQNHKAATYSQISRLFASSLYSLNNEDYLITSDVDMLVFKNPIEEQKDGFTILGTDLVPSNQYPICYIGANVGLWREAFNTKSKSIQEKLDEMLGDDDCMDYRANRWQLDQEYAYKIISQYPRNEIVRGKQNEVFAANRIDRDDAFFTNKLNSNIIDYHVHRPAYEEENFNKMLSVINYFYPNEDLSWIYEYRQKYIELL